MTSGWRHYINPEIEARYKSFERAAKTIAKFPDWARRLDQACMPNGLKLVGKDHAVSATFRSYLTELYPLIEWDSEDEAYRATFNGHLVNGMVRRIIDDRRSNQADQQGEGSTPID